MMTSTKYQHAKYITIAGAIANIFLGIIKILGGTLYYSHALVADGIHSLSDLLTDIMVLFATKYGHKDADTKHPYGHKRIETASTLILAMLLILAGCGIIWDAIFEFFIIKSQKPMHFAIIIAVFSMLLKEILFIYTNYIGKKIQSKLIITNAWHHHADASASAIVVVGLIGAFYGLAYFDTIAAMIIGAMIIKMGINYGWQSITELIDTAVTPDDLEKIKHIIYNIKGVKKIHQLRSRSMSGDILIDVHVIVDPLISVSEGHYIAQHVHVALIKNLAFIKDVTVHIDPEDDERSNPSLNLPNRSQLEQQFFCNWQKLYPNIQDFIIHYLDGKLIIDIITNSDKISDDIMNMIKKDLHKLDIIRNIRFYSINIDHPI